MPFNWASLTNPEAPAELAAAPARPALAEPRIRGQYDNAQTTPENQRNWFLADTLSAKSANSAGVRRTLRTRSRYEVSNNPFLFGICNSNADDLIGAGPTLQVTTKDAAYNREVEAAWKEWCDEVGLVEKLRTCKLAKTVDGEGFLVLKTVEDLEHPVKLYPCDVEADQVTTVAPANLSEYWVDGLTLHPTTGRPTHYHVMRAHPGDFFFSGLNPLATDKIAARHVLHWFGKFRPGQVRGVPTFTSSLDLFNELRAFRRAVLGAAELAADFAAVIQQSQATGAVNEDDDDTEIEAFKRVPIDRKMMTALPPGALMNQFDPKQPTTTYEMFQSVCLGEACRPLSYPLVLALGTSQKFNFSSAKLDFTGYRAGMRVERTQCEAVALNPLFKVWYEEAVLAGVVRAYDGTKFPPHEWHWPGWEPLDAVADATADHDRLSNGTLTLQQFWAGRGYDWRDVLKQQAAERAEVERLGLRFGDPVKQNVTQTEDETEPANAA